MSRFSIVQLLISGVFVFLLLILLNPLKLLMPNSVNTMLILGLVVIFILFTSFIFKERSVDEREQLHKFMAGRIAYLLGTAVLVIGVVMQALSHSVDPWLIYSLCAMIIGKILGLFYGQLKY
jgi:hypothetical protein